VDSDRSVSFFFFWQRIRSRYRTNLGAVHGEGHHSGLIFPSAPHFLRDNPREKPSHAGYPRVFATASQQEKKEPRWLRDAR